MNILCKIGKHSMYYYDYPDLSSEYQKCSKCGYANVYVDNNHKLHLLDEFKSGEEIKKLSNT